MKIMIALTALIWSTSFLGCIAPKPVQEEAKKFEPKIVFFFFNIKKESNGMHTIKLTEYKASTGAIKKTVTNLRNPSRVLTAQFYHGDQLVYTHQLDHPLYPTFETSHEGHGHLQTVSPERDSASFVIRMNVTHSDMTIKWEEQIDKTVRAIPSIKVSIQ